MSNYHLKNKTLSLKSKGLLSMMLSLPEEWNYSTRGLAAICKEGVDAIGAALKELESAGYIIRNQLRGERGRIIDTEYVIYEKPQDKPQPDTPKPDKAQTPVNSGFSPHTAFPYMDNPDTVNPDMDNPDTVKPDTENPAQYITNLSSTKKRNIDSLNTQSINPSNSTPASPKANAPPKKDRLMDRMDSIAAYREMIMDNIEYDYLIQQYGRERMDEVISQHIYVQLFTEHPKPILTGNNHARTHTLQEKDNLTHHVSSHCYINLHNQTI